MSSADDGRPPAPALLLLSSILFGFSTAALLRSAMAAHTHAAAGRTDGWMESNKGLATAAYYYL
jgi:hypothetical protein